MSYHFRREHFKNTLNTYLFFVSFCGYQNKTNQFFARSRQKRQNLENFAFQQFCDHTIIFSPETAGVFLKTPFGYRVQSFLNYKIARKVYKKVYKHFENKKLEFSLILSRSNELFTYKVLTFSSILHAY